MSRFVRYRPSLHRLRCLRVSRGAIKTVSYALMHLGVAMAVAFALTRNWHAALAIGMIEPMVQTFAYSMHERAWARGGL